MLLEIKSRGFGRLDGTCFVVPVRPEPYRLGFRGVDLPGEGVQVVSVNHRSPATNLFRRDNANQRITLEPGDVITAVAGKPVRSLNEYHQALSGETPGKVRITIRDVATGQLVELATPAALSEEGPGRHL
jgi:S1-C subfamily serine protease